MFKTFVLFAAVLGLSGCDTVAAAAGTGWPADVFTPEIGGIYGQDLSEGAPIDLAWAADAAVACWVETENQNFDGNHVFFGFVQPADSVLTVAVTPAPGVDVSMYLITQNLDEFAVPPVIDNSPQRCEAGFDQVHDSNPSETEYVEVLGYPVDTNTLIGVAGVDGADAGAFELEIFAVAAQ